MLVQVILHTLLIVVLYFRISKDTTSSVYKRLSAHITLDLPDLPELSDALRETAYKVESIMNQARTSNITSASEDN